jgi:hypothetical protein
MAPDTKAEAKKKADFKAMEKELRAKSVDELSNIIPFKKNRVTAIKTEAKPEKKVSKAEMVRTILEKKFGPVTTEKLFGKN